MNLLADTQTVIVYRSKLDQDANEGLYALLQLAGEHYFVSLGIIATLILLIVVLVKTGYIR